MGKRFVLTAVIVLALVGSGLGMATAATSPRGPFEPPTVQMSSYDDHLDAIVTTDSSSKAEAKALGINYAPTLGALKPRTFPDIYLVKGVAASGQVWVLGAEPGEDLYAPIWREVIVTWNEGVTPVLLTSDTQIDEAAAAGSLTETPRPVLLNSAVIAESVAPGATVLAPAVFKTFYDGHRDGMLATDVSTKPQATAEGINYSPVLAQLDPDAFPEIYIVRGRVANGQLMVQGSEPGEPDYSPLWKETIVRWRKGVTPTVIKSDTQVDRLIEAGKVTEHETDVILNCPVTGVGGSGSSARSSARALSARATSASLAATDVQRVKMVDFAFRAKTITISKGTRVRWTNKGAVAHTSTSNTGKWDSGTIAPGGSFSRVFRAKGTFRYHCSIHSSMTGKIVVE